MRFLSSNEINLPYSNSSTVEEPRPIALFKTEENLKLPFENSFWQRNPALSINDFDLLQKCVGIVSDFSEIYDSQPYFPRSSLIHALSDFRLIRLLFPNRSSGKIVDIQPGVGLLGLIATLEAYPYLGLENIKEHYLIQNRLWGFATISTKFREIVTVAQNRNREVEYGTEFNAMLHTFFEGIGEQHLSPALDELTTNGSERILSLVHCPRDRINDSLNFTAQEFNLLIVDGDNPDQRGWISSSASISLQNWFRPGQDLKCLVIRHWGLLPLPEQQNWIAVLENKNCFFQTEFETYGVFSWGVKAKAGTTSFLQDRISHAITRDEEAQVIGKEQIDTLYTLLNSLNSKI